MLLLSQRPEDLNPADSQLVFSHESSLPIPTHPDPHGLRLTPPPSSTQPPTLPFQLRRRTESIDAALAKANAAAKTAKQRFDAEMRAIQLLMKPRPSPDIPAPPPSNTSTYSEPTQLSVNSVGTAHSRASQTTPAASSITPTDGYAGANTLPPSWDELVYLDREINQVVFEIDILSASTDGESTILFDNSRPLPLLSDSVDEIVALERKFDRTLSNIHAIDAKILHRDMKKLIPTGTSTPVAPSTLSRRYHRRHGHPLKKRGALLSKVLPFVPSPKRRRRRRRYRFRYRRGTLGTIQSTLRGPLSSFSSCRPQRRFQLNMQDGRAANAVLARDIHGGPGVELDFGMYSPTTHKQ